MLRKPQKVTPGSETTAGSEKACSEKTETSRKLVKSNPKEIIPPLRQPEGRNRHARVKNNIDVRDNMLQYDGNPSEPRQVQKSALCVDTPTLPTATPRGRDGDEVRYNTLVCGGNPRDLRQGQRQQQGQLKHAPT